MEELSVKPQKAQAMPSQFTAAEALEDFLGNPCDANKYFSFKRAVSLDEQEQYPDELIYLLNLWELNHYYIPKDQGGKLGSLEEIFSLIRTVSRRDLTVAIAHGGALLGSMPVWVAGNEEQKKQVAVLIKEHKKIALGLTEKEHGSDLMSCKVKAENKESGYSINGEKWCVNHASRGDAIILYASSGAGLGARGFSLFLVDKRLIEQTSYTSLDKIKTHGVKGLDLSGISFQNTFVSEKALISKEGAGLEITLKSLQVTRTLCAAFSLGAFDTTLRVVMDFAVSRNLYQHPIINFPVYREKLSQCFADMLACECLSFAINRAFHFIPGQFTLFSAIVKSYVPCTIEKDIQELSSLLGARYYMRDEYLFGIFQKQLRDCATISLFDGNTAINQHSIILQLKSVAMLRRKKQGENMDKTEATLKKIFTLRDELPEIDLTRLDVFNKGKDDLIYGLFIAQKELNQLLWEGDIALWLLTDILEKIEECIRFLTDLDQLLIEEALPVGVTGNIPAEYYRYAEKYAILHVASACVNIWLNNRGHFKSYFEQGEWVSLCLSRLLDRLNATGHPFKAQMADNMVGEICSLHKENKLFSLYPISLGSF